MMGTGNCKERSFLHVIILHLIANCPQKQELPTEQLLMPVDSSREGWLLRAPAAPGSVGPWQGSFHPWRLGCVITRSQQQCSDGSARRQVRSDSSKGGGYEGEGGKEDTDLAADWRSSVLVAAFGAGLCLWTSPSCPGLLWCSAGDFGECQCLDMQLGDRHIHGLCLCDIAQCPGVALVVSLLSHKSVTQERCTAELQTTGRRHSSSHPNL